MDCSPPGSSVSGDSPGQNAFLQEIFPTQGSKPGLPHCRWVLYCVSPGKPKNTGVGGLSLLQGIFPIQEPNLGLLYCRQIFYQLSYTGSPSHSLIHTNHPSCTSSDPSQTLKPLESITKPLEKNSSRCRVCKEILKTGVETLQLSPIYNIEFVIQE